VSHAFAGDLGATHAAACATAREVAMQEVPQPYPVVVTSNAGYPLDQNLYQAVKGMRSAAQVVAPGGLVLCIAECSDGLPSPSPFAEQVGAGLGPEELLRRINGRVETVPDQWQVQVLAEMQVRHRIAVHCEGIEAAVLRSAGLEPVADVGERVREALADAGPDARVCVLPEGPETIPFVRQTS
jgi:nickel-dependent lactate racemase